MKQRVVFLSDHNANGRNLTPIFAERGIVFDAVVVEGRSLVSAREGGRAWLRSLAFVLRRIYRFHRTQKLFYRDLKSPVRLAGKMNSARMRRILQQLAPDYLVIGCNGILSAELIATARCGVINTHPALLPWMRGSGVVGHSLYCGVAVGATLHFIDPGIDTGSIIERRLLPVQPTNTELKALESAASALGGQMMADVVERIQRGETLCGVAQTARYPLFRWSNRNERQTISKLAQLGRAHQLFEAWQSCTSGAPNWIVSPDCVEAPVPIALREKS